MNTPADGPWYRFFITCYARPDPLPTSDPLPASQPKSVTELSSASLSISPSDLSAPLGVNFEEACEALSRLPRMFCEPDGSFVWRGGENPVWQVDGVLYDAAPGLMYVELKGACPAIEFDRLLASLGHDRVPLVFQLVREGRMLDAVAFRHWASGL